MKGIMTHQQAHLKHMTNWCINAADVAWTTCNENMQIAAIVVASLSTLYQHTTWQWFCGSQQITSCLAIRSQLITRNRCIRNPDAQIRWKKQTTNPCENKKLQTLKTYISCDQMTSPCVFPLTYIFLKNATLISTKHYKPIQNTSVKHI